MLCEEVTALLPGMVDGDVDVDPQAMRHVETCLRCQAELARYRKLLRTLALLRTRYAELPKDRDIWICCGVGQRAYYVTRLLAQHGYRSRILSGGYTTYKAFRAAGLAP